MTSHSTVVALRQPDALDPLRADTTRKVSLKGRRKTAAWEDVYMARLLRG